MDERNLYEKYIKRGLDIILAAVGLIVLSWLFLLISVMILVDDPGPVIFKQKRFGKNKQLFFLHKFRSMKTNAPKNTPTRMFDNPDKYITRVGGFLRQYSLDELPQLWDILLGHMSVIGPRPVLSDEIDLIVERDKYGANEILPGLTGWAQINGRDRISVPVKARLDGEYVKKLRAGGMKAFLFDCRCFFRTFPDMLKHKDIIEGKIDNGYREQAGR